MKNSEENVFEGISAKTGEDALWKNFIAANDFTPGTIRGMRFDVRRLKIENQELVY